MMESAKEAEIQEEKKKQRRSFIYNVRHYFREYCQCTSIHGFRYFGEKRTIFERIWWFFIFSIVLALLSIAIYLVYDKWHSSPVLVSFAHTETPIHQIPFPAVTICPETKAKSTIFNYTDIVYKKSKNMSITEEQDKYLNYLSLVCTRLERPPPLSNVTTFPDSFYKDITRITPPFNVWGCKFIGQKTKCRSVFFPVLTEEGPCYSFNILDRKEVYSDIVRLESTYQRVHYKAEKWSPESGYDKDAEIFAYPFRALISGAQNALVLKMAVNLSHVDYMCKELQGFRVVLHSPASVPRPSQKYFRVPLSQAVVVSVQPTLLNTSKSVRNYDPEKRQCFFGGERKLAFFKIYTQKNCEMECLTNHTRRGCGCVNFFMPRQNSTPLCGTGSMQCMKEAEDLMHVHNLEVKLQVTSARVKYLKGLNCDCKPLCSDLSYDALTSQVDWDWKRSYIAAHRLDDLIEDFGSDQNVHLSSLRVYFKSDHFITLQRNELYGPTDFLANFGGLLGLFTGFSILSLMEIVYFLSVRLLCNIKLFGNWAGSST